MPPLGSATGRDTGFEWRAHKFTSAHSRSPEKGFKMGGGANASGKILKLGDCNWKPYAKISKIHDGILGRCAFHL